MTPASRVKRTSSVLEISGDGAAHIAVVADTHSSPHPLTLERLKAMRPRAILHGGDIGDLHVLEDLSTVAPVIAVRGNIDTHAPEIPDQRVIEIQRQGATVVRLLLVHIAVYGPRIRAEIARTARQERASMVVCGHSHVPFIGRDQGLVVFNPGSVGPRRFHLPILYGQIDLGPEGIRLQHRSVETGEPWSPPSR